MPYQVLARKWRPQTFGEVVGQEHIARTLRNAIVTERTGHAYLFVGSRGIGKTTSARIFAKALNCTSNQGGEPCCQCENCREIAAGNSMDVIEIDGASHNKVEDMRDIREQVQYVPSKCRYKIYIIDEVHMLTSGAWNALLKTLEEPPPHVKFLFATTEPHKVLPTIISRCQRFDLKRIPAPLIAQRLRLIADNEKLFVDDAALNAIARAADGGMRDAQSIFDQMIAFCGGMNAAETIREQDVINVFGLASGGDLKEIAAGIFTNQLDRALNVVAALADAGRDLERVYEDLVGYIRNLMLAGCCRDASNFIEASPEELSALCGIASQVQPRVIQNTLQLLVANSRSFRDSMNKRIALEVMLAQVITEIHSVQLDQILTHLNVLSGLIPPEAAQLPQLPNLPPMQTPVQQVPVQQVPVQQVPVQQVPVQQVPVQPVSAPVQQMSEPVQVIQPAPEPSAPVSVPEPAPVVEAAPATTEVQELPPPPQEEYCEEYTGGCEVIVTDVPVQSEAEVQPEAPQKLSAAELFRSMQVNAPLETPASEVPQAPAGSNYRRVTPEEYRDLSNHPAAQEIVRELNAEIYDVRKRISE